MLTYYSLRFGMLLAAIVPHRLAYWLCSVVGNIAFFGNGTSRQAVWDNMRHVLGPQASRRQVDKLSRYVFRNTVKNYYELLCLPRLSQAELKQRVTVVGVENLDAARQGGHGVILFSGHIGNFNLAAQIAGGLGYPTNIIAEQMAPPRLHELVNGLRSRFGLKLIPLGPTAVRGIYHALRANEILGLAADRDLTENSVPVEFFGEITELPSGLAALSLRLNAPLVPVHVVRKSNDSSVVTVYPALELARTGDRDQDTLAGTRQIARVVEAMIRKTPEQWVVLQPVWPDAPQSGPQDMGQPAADPERPPRAVPPTEPAAPQSKSA